MEWISQRIDLTRLEKSDLFCITLRHDDAEVAAQIVNAVTDAYFNVRLKYGAQRASKDIGKVERERAVHATKITRLTSNLIELTKEYGGAKDVSEKNRLDMDLQLKKEELNKAKTTLSLFSQRIVQLRTEHPVPGRVQLLKKASGQPR